jgi:anaerobic selenocysteine-containing dehydrogenase
MRGGFGRNPAQPPVPFADRFPTPSGKMRLIEQPPEAVPAKDGFPLLLLTPSARSWQASQWAEECQDWPLECRVHPTASGVGGRQDGARAVLASPTGKLTVRLRLDPTLPEDLCQVQPGGWARLGCAINDLIGAQATDLGEGTAYYDQRVRLEP